MSFYRRGASGAQDQPSERKRESRSNVGYNPPTDQMQVNYKPVKKFKPRQGGKFKQVNHNSVVDECILQARTSSNSRSEVFGSRQQDKTVSGFLVGPTKEHRGSRESRKDSTDQANTRVSFSGPLAPGPVNRKGSKDLDHSSSRSNLSNLSSLVASRTVLGRDNQERSDTSDSRTKVGRFSGPINGMEPVRRQDNSRYQVRRNGDARPRDDGRVGTKDSNQVISFYQLNIYDV